MLSTIPPLAARKYIHACFVGDVDTVTDMFRKENNKFISDRVLHNCLINACKGNHHTIYHLIFSAQLDRTRNLDKCEYDPDYGESLSYYQSELYHAFRSGCIEFIDAQLTSLEKSHYYENLQNVLYGACETNNIYLFEKYRYLDHCGVRVLNKCLPRACKSKTFNREMINYLVNKGANSWKNCLPHACKSGCLETLKLVLENLKPGPDYCWNKCLVDACMSESLEMVEFMFEKCTTDLIDTETRSECMWNACFMDNMDVINLLIKKGCNDWNHALHGACLYGHRREYGAYEYGNIENAKVMVLNGATDLNYYLSLACSGGSAELAKFFIRSGASVNDRQHSFNSCLYQACFCYDLDLIKMLTSTDYTDWEIGLEGSCDSGNIEIFMYMLNCGTFTIGYLNEMLKLCAYNNHVDMINILLRLLRLLKNVSPSPQSSQSLSFLEKVKDFKLHCRYVTSLGNCPKSSPKYLEYLCKFEPYILFVGSRVTKPSKRCKIKKLPAELFRLLVQY